ncbi:MAG: hypothetical protein IK128_01145 [Clostridiales bacterium]|nr:hypothetical protein [Clostridiales bacterium]
MGNIVLKNISVRGLVFSAVFVVVGMIITAIGVRETVIYHSQPVSADRLQSSFEDNTRVKLTDYRVAGVIDMKGYSYFIIEYSEGRYCLVETTKDKYFYNRLKVQDKRKITGQDLVIDGYLYHLEDYQLDSIREALTKSGIDSSQIDIMGGHAVKILTEEYTFLVIGPVLILMSVGAYVLSKRLFGSQRDQ